MPKIQNKQNEKLQYFPSKHTTQNLHQTQGFTTHPTHRIVPLIKPYCPPPVFISEIDNLLLFLVTIYDRPVGFHLSFDSALCSAVLRLFD